MLQTLTKEGAFNNTLQDYQRESRTILPDDLVEILWDGHWEEPSFGLRYRVRLRMFNRSLEFGGHFMQDIFQKVEYSYYTFLVEEEKKILEDLKGQVTLLREDVKFLRDLRKTPLKD